MVKKKILIPDQIAQTKLKIAAIEVLPEGALRIDGDEVSSGNRVKIFIQCAWWKIYGPNEEEIACVDDLTEDNRRGLSRLIGACIWLRSVFVNDMDVHCAPFVMDEDMAILTASRAQYYGDGAVFFFYQFPESFAFYSPKLGFFIRGNGLSSP